MPNQCRMVGTDDAILQVEPPDMLLEPGGGNGVVW